MGAAGRFFFDQDDAGLALASLELSDDTEADHTAADDKEVARSHLVPIELYSQYERVPS